MRPFAPPDTSQIELPCENMHGNLPSRIPTPHKAFTVSHQGHASMPSSDLQKMLILDSGADIHVCNASMRQLYTKERESGPYDRLEAGKDELPIESFGTLAMQFDTPNGPELISLLNVAYVPEFLTSVASLDLFMAKGCILTPKFHMHAKGKTIFNIYKTGGHFIFNKTQRQAIQASKVHQVYAATIRTANEATHYPTANETTRTANEATQNRTASKATAEKAPNFDQSLTPAATPTPTATSAPESTPPPDLLTQQPELASDQAPGGKSASKIRNKAYHNILTISHTAKPIRQYPGQYPYHPKQQSMHPSIGQNPPFLEGRYQYPYPAPYSYYSPPLQQSSHTSDTAIMHAIAKAQDVKKLNCSDGWPVWRDHLQAHLSMVSL